MNIIQLVTSVDGWHVYVGVASILIASAVHLALTNERSWQHAAELLLLYSMGISGFRGIFAGIVMHFFFADQVAASIGWPAGNPFQSEVAFANLAIGVLGAATFWRRDFWLPYIAASSIFAWGAGLTHVLDIMQQANFAPDNAGPILYADFLMPCARIALYLLYRHGQEHQRHRPRLAGAA